MKGNLKIMARFSKLNESKSAQKSSIRRKTLKWAAAMIASMVAMAPLGLTSHGAHEAAIAGADVKNYCAWVYLIQNFNYLYLVNHNGVVVKYVPETFQRNGDTLGLLAWKSCPFDYAVSKRPLELGYRLQHGDTVGIITQSRITALTGWDPHRTNQGNSLRVSERDRAREQLEVFEETAGAGLERIERTFRRVCPCAPTCSVQ
jgi:hypothetical protein